jgi:bifunctional DNA-binding transcriptional regulator/antitoxin component of YhaV-PrlF toxin-antitoxin module
MGTKKYHERQIRKLTRTGKGSMCVTIPIEDLRELGWREKQKVIVKKVGKKLVITDWEK